MNASISFLPARWISIELSIFVRHMPYRTTLIVERPEACRYCRNSMAVSPLRIGWRRLIATSSLCLLL
jgi:hypothetical protein